MWVDLQSKTRRSKTDLRVINFNCNTIYNESNEEKANKRCKKSYCWSIEQPAWPKVKYNQGSQSISDVNHTSWSKFNERGHLRRNRLRNIASQIKARRRTKRNLPVNTPASPSRLQNHTSPPSAHRWNFRSLHFNGVNV